MNNKQENYFSHCLSICVAVCVLAAIAFNASCWNSTGRLQQPEQTATNGPK